jgi:hypothetical protein
MHELIVNLHMHTVYSDGSGVHAKLAQSALKQNVDVLLVTDHNVWVQGVEGYQRLGKKRVLVLSGEEVHDQGRDPQKNHLLVLGAEREMATLAENPQTLIDAVREAGGLTFIAHPDDPALPAYGQTDITWVDWQVRGFTGIELWNGFSELKAVARGKFDTLFYAFFPEAIARGPLNATLRRWDDLMAGGTRVVAIGGSDAHANSMSLGPLRKTIFPYEFHFSAVNTHLLTARPLTGNLRHDRNLVLEGLSEGHCFVGYDLPASSRGFRFSAQGKDRTAILGDKIACQGSITLQAKVPFPAEILLLKNGDVIESAYGEALVHVTAEPGVYRVEVYKRYLGRRRGWIFSNPIYLTAPSR